MPQSSGQVSVDIEQYLRNQENKSLLRFITCGSVDDGKSTLIGRLLFDSKMLFEDQLAALAEESKKCGSQGSGLDFALLVDGLASEREQGITIDVAYRFFSTERRKFIVADTPGHEQYTRNMVTGASTADAAIVIVDARKGVQVQTRRHSFLASLLGIRHVVVAINKIDLVDYDQSIFRQIVENYSSFARQLSFADVTYIPISALNGDNVITTSLSTAWYQGPTLLQFLESVEIREEQLLRSAFRLPVQWVNRPNPEFRGIAGTLAGGVVRRGDRVRVAPSGQESRVNRIVMHSGDLEHAVAGQAVTLILEDEIDVSRGDVLSAAESPIEIADQLKATVVWMGADPLIPGRQYFLKCGSKTVTASVTAIKYKINVNTFEQVAAKTLELNAIGVCNLRLDQPIAFDPYRDNRDTGGFIFIDKISNNTIGAGFIEFALRRAANIHMQRVDVNKTARSVQKGQRACAVWFTGLSGAGKSSIANLVEKKLHAANFHTYLIDGDNVRHGLSKDLGFTDADRVENIRRVAEVTKLMVDAGLIVLTALISPFRSDREMARGLLPEGDFLEIFVDTPLAVAEERDTKGLYRKARQGVLQNFTGVDSPYERPPNPELRIDTVALTLDEAAEIVVMELKKRGFLL